MSNKKIQDGINQFMDFASNEETGSLPINEDAPGGNHSSSAKFMQKGLNAYAESTGQPMLKEDGIMGPQTMASVQEMIKTLPPEIKRWAVNKLHKESNKMGGDAGSTGREGFDPNLNTPEDLV